MEKNEHYSGMDDIGSFEAWDAVPRDGPAVFIIDTLALEQRQELRGRWLSLKADDADLAAALGELLGRPIDDGWAIVDQVGLGPRMAPETLRPEELPRLTEQLRHEESA